METITSITLSGAFLGLVFILIGILAARLARKAVSKVSQEHISQHQSLLLQRVVFYALLAIFAVMALQQMGLNLGVLLGAAGILTVAIGFASQTSASNIISGLFLIGEKPFMVGDIIQVADVRGEVISIDFLSVKLRTFDNLFVRIPNETIIKTQVTTITKYPIRRFDLRVGVAYKTDIEKVIKLLLQVTENYNLCLDDPEPKVHVLGFFESSIDLQLSAWTTRENMLQFKNDLTIKVKKIFEANEIEIPFPHRTLIHQGSNEGATDVGRQNKLNSNQEAK